MSGKRGEWTRGPGLDALTHTSGASIHTLIKFLGMEREYEVRLRFRTLKEAKQFVIRASSGSSEVR